MVNSRIFLLIIVLCSSNFLFAQKQTNYWYFGKKAGLNFNVLPPQVLHDGAVSTIEGCASISDNNGQLLFYTNGLTVINKDHLPMLNGTGLMGNISSTDNTLIVPSPAGDGIYYLFTMGASGYPFEAFRYNIIDMKRDNGLGEVVTKNLILEDENYEKLAAVRHCNKRDVWITVRKWDSDEYHTYLLTAAGLNTTPVISNTGNFIGGQLNNSLGTLKFSPDGSKLAAIHSFENDAVELMNFDNTTGMLSNAVYFHPNTIPAASNYIGVYGAEFSPNSQLLYVSSVNNPINTATLYQFNVSVLNANNIMASKQLISQTGRWNAGALQAAPDNKIYFTMWQDTSLSVIENPDVYGPGCNFRYHKILISNTESEPLQYGLPIFVAGDMDARFTAFDFSYITDCSTYDVAFTVNKLNGVDSVRWDFGDGQQSTAFAPSHSYLTGGDYPVTLTLFKLDCWGNSENIVHTVQLGRPAELYFLPKDTSLCFTDTFAIRSSVASSVYLWNTGASTDSVILTQSGQYWLEIEKNGCRIRDTFNLGIGDPVQANAGNDTTVCTNKPVTLTANVSSSYLWNTGERTRSIDIIRPGTYAVTIFDTGGCMDSDSLVAYWGDCGFYIPSAFTPNGDKLNDEFSLSNGMTVESFTMNIYNRYGQVIFNSNQPLNKWDGTFNGKKMPQGAYPWLIVYIKNGFKHIEKGTVMLIR